MNVHYVVELTPTERGDLEAVVSSGTTRARKLKHAQVLLAADAGVADRIIATTVGVGAATIYRTSAASWSAGSSAPSTTTRVPGRAAS